MDNLMLPFAFTHFFNIVTKYMSGNANLMEERKFILAYNSEVSIHAQLIP